jgi:hypothetical protein
MRRVALITALFVLPLAARTVDVSSEETAWVHTGAKISIEFSIWNYGVNNPGSSPYPTDLSLMLLTQQPAETNSSIPWTSATYYEDYLFSAALESLDGSVSVPLNDELMAYLGLEAGKLVLGPGTTSMASSSGGEVGVLFGNMHLTQDVSAALFGSDLAARIVLRNLGQGVWIGVGNGYNVRNSTMVVGVAGEGPNSVGGITRSVIVSNPEPSTWLLAAGALLLLIRGQFRPCRLRRHPRA